MPAANYVAGTPACAAESRLGSRGAVSFEQTMDVADELYITKIDAEFGCDRFYPEYENKFDLVQESQPKSQNGFNFVYTVYRPKP